ncbi:sensor histidine kinase [Saccharomonospora halophila]|uniref:sensor histidine kinase n=1 Tax=Saccharomonospora halophila TaxID=129922 RepID=UPI0003742B50|nr:histidine kinase [Saccharomonospora halophila]
MAATRSTRLSTALSRLGPPGAVLVAALFTDFLIISTAGFDRSGPRGSELWLLPGIAGLTACALAAPARPARSAWTGSAVLVASSALVAGVQAASYTALLSGITFTETVAGLVLLYHGVRVLPTRGAVFAGGALVLGTLVAVRLRQGAVPGSSLDEALLTGPALLVLTVTAGLVGRDHTTERPGRFGRFGRFVLRLRGQWPAAGVLAGGLFFELVSVSAQVRLTALLFLFSLAGAVGALTAVRRPVRAAVVFGAVLTTTTVVAWVLGGPGVSGSVLYPSTGGVPLGQVASGVVVVVALVRQVPPRRAGVLVGGMSAVVAAVAVFHTAFGHATPLRTLFVGASLLLGIAVATGLFLRARDADRARTLATAVHDAQTAERMALARELHDVVAHHVTGIVVQAQAARMVAARNPHAAVDALEGIEQAGTDAMSAMRRLVRSMREQAQAGAGEFSARATTDPAADLRTLIDSANHGVPTTAELDLPADLPGEVARSVLRLVQESLTNVGKHATGATAVRVRACTTADALHVEISDDGTGLVGGPTDESGYGLVGMRERVELMRGSLSAGPADDGGWRVRAWIPLAAGSAGAGTEEGQ